MGDWVLGAGYWELGIIDIFSLCSLPLSFFLFPN